MTFYYSDVTEKRPGVRVRRARPSVVDARIDTSAPGEAIEVRGAASSSTWITVGSACVGDFPPATCRHGFTGAGVLTGRPKPRDRDSMYGSITDSAGRPVRRARVVARRVGTGEVFATSTDRHGHYDVPLLPSGHYDVTVVSGGRQDRATSVVVEGGRRTKLDLELR